ncbi:MAG: substrate-binding domain-containing protein [Planctomycetota bacterium]
MSKTQRVALIVAMSFTYGRGVLRGICAYAKQGKPWVFNSALPGSRAGRLLAEWEPAGVIGHLSVRSDAEAVVQLSRPAVNVSGVVEDVPVPRVGVDDIAIGKMAAEHFVERGFRTFGFIGERNTAYSDRRLSGFREKLQSHGADCEVFMERGGPIAAYNERSWKSSDAAITHWLKSLSMPAAVFACNDVMAVRLSEGCRLAELRVPEDIAIAGVDDDELLCDMARPPLSSVRLPLEQVGFEAAKLLDGMLNGKTPPAKSVLLPPSHVVTRQSSDILAVNDPEVAKALRFIRGNAGEQIGVRDVLAACSVSRRVLERRFQKALGRSPLDEIIRVRIERAKEILAGTHLPMSAVAEASGFNGASRLSVVFRNHTDMTPTQYRRRFRRS